MGRLYAIWVFTLMASMSFFAQDGVSEYIYEYNVGDFSLEMIQEEELWSQELELCLELDALCDMLFDICLELEVEDEEVYDMFPDLWEPDYEIYIFGDNEWELLNEE